MRRNIVLCILNFSTGGEWVCFSLWPLFPRGRISGALGIRNWVGPRAGLVSNWVGRRAELNRTIFWKVTPCSHKEILSTFFILFSLNRYFALLSMFLSKSIYSPYQTRFSTSDPLSLPPAPSSLLYRLIFRPKVGGSIFPKSLIFWVKNNSSVMLPLHAPAVLRAYVFWFKIIFSQLSWFLVFWMHKAFNPYWLHNLQIFFPGMFICVILYVSQVQGQQARTHASEVCVRLFLSFFFHVPYGYTFALGKLSLHSGDIILIRFFFCSGLSWP
jgi:hypothetical protein